MWLVNILHTFDSWLTSSVMFLPYAFFFLFGALQLMQSWVFYVINIANNNKQYPSVSSIFVSLVTRRAVVLESKNHSWTFPTMLGAVASLLVVVGKRMQQLPTMFKPESTKERIQPIRLCKPRVMHVRGLNNVGRAVQTDPTLLLMLWQSQNKTNVGSCRLKS